MEFIRFEGLANTTYHFSVQVSNVMNINESGQGVLNPVNSLDFNVSKDGILQPTGNVEGLKQYNYFYSNDKKNVWMANNYAGLNLWKTIDSGTGEIIIYMEGAGGNKVGLLHPSKYVSKRSFEYKSSLERNAYPDSGEVDEISYSFLGIPFSNALFLSKSDIQV